MRIAGYAIASAIGLSMGLGYQGVLAPPQQPNQSDKLTAESLKTMSEGLGIEVKVLNAEVGKEKYTLSMKTTSLNIPVGAEISPSGNYIWLTVNLGNNSSTKKHEELLKQNGVIQPAFFYITSSGRLMMAHPIDNRSISPVVLKRCLDKIVADVDKTNAIWKD